LSLHYHTKSFSADIAGFYNLIPGYIYLSPTDLYEDDLLLYRYMQHDARLFGAEASVKYQPVSWIEMNGQLSIIRGVLNENSYLPFVPHDKIKAGVKLMQSEIGFVKQSYFSVNVNYAFGQNCPSQFETATSDWFVTSLAMGTTVALAGTDAVISFNVTNLFNEKYFDHLSTIKQVGYYNPGRSAALRLKWMF
jgi:iron complex outermembrane receptor protein